MLLLLLLLLLLLDDDDDDTHSLSQDTHKPSRPTLVAGAKKDDDTKLVPKRRQCLGSLFCNILSTCQ